MTPDYIEEAHARWTKSRDHSKEWREEARTDYDMVAGHQWSVEEMAYLEENLRPAITMNRTGPVIDSVVGHQVTNRQEIKYVGREVGDAQVNELLTGAYQWVADQCGEEHEQTDMFRDAAICGMGWTETRISYDEDPDGKIFSAERVSPLEMFWDPTARKQNLSDARYVMRARWIARIEAEERWPKARDIQPGDGEVFEDLQDGAVPHDAARAFEYKNTASEWYRQHTDEVLILQYQWWVREPMYRVGDPMSNRLVELSESKYEKLKDYIQEKGLPVIRQLKRKYYQAFLLGKHELEKTLNPCPTDFTLKAKTVKRDQNQNTWFALGRVLRDPQKWSNKFFSDIQDIMASNRTGGAFVEEDALKDPRRAEEIWNDSNPLIIVNSGAIGANKIRERNPIQYPTGLDRLLQFAITAIPDVTGINLEMMGMVDRNQPGILEAQRKQASLTILAPLFDGLRKHQRERGKVVLYFIKNYISDGRLIRITGQNGLQQYVPLVRQPDTITFDTVVEQSPTSPNVKQETFQILTEIAPFVLQAGYPLPPEILDYLPLPSTLTNAWKRTVMEASEQPGPVDQAKIQKDSSQAKLNQARARKTLAEIETDVAELKREMYDSQTDRLKVVVDANQPRSTE
jgi:hypothetical protein